MVDHAPAPTAYDRRWPKSPLTETDRQHLRTAIRQLRRGRLDSCRLSLDAHPAIAKVALAYADVDAGLSLDVYLVEDAVDAGIVANERCDPGGIVTLNDDPHFLRDLAPCWHHLEADLITGVSAALDLPPAAEELAPYTVAPVGLRCTTAHTGSLACFASVFYASLDTRSSDKPA